VGKTTLGEELVQELEEEHKTYRFNCDNPTDREFLENQDLTFLQQTIGDAKVLFIDEGQKVTNIGQTLKLLVDHYKTQLQILVTGSSSIDLHHELSESLTGRKISYTLLPIALEELFKNKNPLDFQKNMELLLLYGSYPEILTQNSIENKRMLIQEIQESYLYKDLLQYGGIRNSRILQDLVKALALQIGSEVSYSELANLLGIDKKTVERYIDLLEKTFVVFRLAPFSRNKRREITKTKKIYFYDLGIRNGVLQNFSLLSQRNDVGALWENFVIVERLKHRLYHNIYGYQHFWRTFDGSEVDLVEERDGNLYGYEVKWNPKRKTRTPIKWMEYPNSSFEKITQENLLAFCGL
jgi:predicted AAA+ superfamily ATPase